MKTSEMKQWLVDEIGFVPVDDEDGVEFYYTAMHDHGFGLYDTDDYAWLNTILRYDIGVEAASAIINWCFDNYDTSVQDAFDVNAKEELIAACDEMGLEIDFSHWLEEDPGAYEYGFKTNEFKEVDV